MDVTFARAPSEFESLRVSWNSLLKRSVTDVPFLRHEYQLAWWSTLGGGEWTDASLWIGLARHPDGDLAGVAPLFHTRTLDGRSGLMLLGSIEISDYLDLIIPSEAMAGFIGGLLDGLAREGPEGWEVIDLYNLPEDSPSLGALTSAARARGWRVQQQSLQSCPVVSLNGEWEAYLSGLEKKQRHELRRKLRRAERYDPPVTWKIVGQGEDLDTAITTFLDLMGHDPGKQRFLSEPMRRQFRAALGAAHANGWLQLALLEVGGIPAAGYLNFDYGGRIWVYNSGIDPRYLDLSLGWVLLGYLIRWAIENGRREFDFLRGDEDYKFRLGGVPRRVQRITIERV
jgi:CelD/BcsL family acetyltransferase involved in cellulose biosynthesis